MPGEIVPFGKYKGQPLEVLAADPGYIEWLEAQPWFQARYPNLYTIVINNFKTSDASPEHNQLQARFLDKQFRAKTIAALEDGFLETVTESFDLEKWISKVGDVVNPAIIASTNADEAYYQKELKAIEAIGPGDFNFKYKEDKLRSHAKKYQEWKAMLKGFRYSNKASCWFQAKFEVEGADIVLSYSCGRALKITECYNNYNLAGLNYNLEQFPETGEYRIELKPSLGEDYPATLRQMKANSCSVLIYREVTARSVSVEQIRELLILSGVSVLSEAEIDAVEIDLSAYGWGAK